MDAVIFEMVEHARMAWLFRGTLESPSAKDHRDVSLCWEVKGVYERAQILSCS